MLRMKLKIRPVIKTAIGGKTTQQALRSRKRSHIVHVRQFPLFELGYRRRVLPCGEEHAQRVLGSSPVADAEDLVGVDAVLRGPGRPHPNDRGGGVHQRSVDVEQDGVDAKAHGSHATGACCGRPTSISLGWARQRAHLVLDRGTTPTPGRPPPGPGVIKRPPRIRSGRALPHQPKSATEDGQTPSTSALRCRRPSVDRYSKWLAVKRTDRSRSTRPCPG